MKCERVISRMPCPHRIARAAGRSRRPKTVQRRILYAMREMGFDPSKQHRKCAGIIGEVLKSYHPHGDSSVYDALVRLAQDFTLRYKLVDGTATSVRSIRIRRQPTGIPKRDWREPRSSC